MYDTLVRVLKLRDGRLATAQRAAAEAADARRVALERALADEADDVLDPGAVTPAGWLAARAAFRDLRATAMTRLERDLDQDAAALADLADARRELKRQLGTLAMRRAFAGGHR